MPHLVGDDLLLRRLLHKTDLCRLAARGNLRKRFTAEQDLPAFAAVRRKDRLELTQKRGFSAAGRAAEHHKIALRDGERHIPQRIALLLRILKTEI